MDCYMFLWRPFRQGGSDSTESPKKHQVLILNSSAPNYFILKEWPTGHQLWSLPPLIVQSWVGRCREVMVNSALFSEMLKAGWSLRDGGAVDQIGTFFLLENVREIDRGWKNHYRFCRISSLGLAFISRNRWIRPAISSKEEEKQA